ncbi:hypothetical protein [Actinomadura fibrosa]|uniref:Uncharacterized protein n=1 Tax=Actinomadura fibrosa TaxID=111802 RepID=A0ABW2Y195_9ACTN|nr:hypothetical protein [Actinomadura fibrosa]
MTESLVKALVDPWTSRWKSTAIGAALLFWLTGAVCYMLTHSTAAAVCATSRSAGSPFWCVITPYPKAAAIALPLLAVAVVATTAAVCARLAPVMITFLAEASWSRLPFLRPLARCRIRRHEKIRKHYGEHAEMASKRTPNDWVEAARDDAVIESRRDYARGELVVGPTRLANIFTATAARIEEAYGLNLQTCWPYLVAVLPPESRADLSAQAAAFQLRAQGLLLALALPLWSLLLGISWWTAVLWLVATVLLIAGHRSMIDAARSYLTEIEALMGLHRRALYDGLGFPRPASTESEPATGKGLSDYLNANTATPTELQWPDSPAPS